MKRREFMKLAGGGVFVFFTVGEPWDWLEAQQRSGGRDYPTDFNAYLRIAEDGKITGFAGKAELGQGTQTALAQIAAEELDVALDRVDMVMGDTALCPWDMGTFGSRSIKYFGPALRQAAAEARGVLIELASEHLRLPVAQLATKDGFVQEKVNPQNRVSYGTLAKGKMIERHLDPKPAVKPPSEYAIVGKPADRKDAVLKVSGRAQYAGDIRLPGMLYARILRPPAHGAKLKAVDLSGAERTEGARIIQDGEMIAVLHSSYDLAEGALSKIRAEWELPEAAVDDETIYEHLVKVASTGDVVEEKGNLEEGKKLAESVFEESYFTPYVAHAPMEPHTATVKIEGGSATVWASTQRPFGLQEEVAQALGLPLEKVRVITPFVGGGFGGKNRNLQTVEAARLAKLAGVPVQVAWSRSEEFFYDTFQPAAVVKIISGADAANRLVLWDYDIFFGGERTSQPFYDIPHYRILSRGSWGRGGAGVHPFEVGAWRAPGSNTNTFARESHMDVMAAKAGLDPVEFRRINLKDERMKRVLAAAAARFGWTAAKAPSGRGFGVSLVNYLNTYVATMAEVEVNKNGAVKVKRVVCAQDMGRVINPDGAKAQIEGCITMGLGYCLSEEIHFRGGAIRDLNFDTYEIPRFSWLPEIEAVLVENRDLEPQGGGEPPIVNMGAVVANAVFDATGARLNRLPITATRLRAALPPRY
ncbi:MAG TPA: molybdopterin cofactor-binding domain-containing protein [Candidatus Desulfaltia sp.]|nr:molybdopterin cofactor-binding domain-containing protein [Candidatus Desulfaltia sp.]